MRYDRVAALRDIGRDKFLNAHGFKHAREYLLVQDGRTHDSKGRAYQQLEPA